MDNPTATVSKSHDYHDGSLQGRRISALVTEEVEVSHRDSVFAAPSEQAEVGGVRNYLSANKGITSHGNISADLIKENLPNSSTLGSASNARTKSAINPSALSIEGSAPFKTIRRRLLKKSSSFPEDSSTDEQKTKPSNPLVKSTSLGPKVSSRAPTSTSNARSESYQEVSSPSGKVKTKYTIQERNPSDGNIITTSIMINTAYEKQGGTNANQQGSGLDYCLRTVISSLSACHDHDDRIEEKYHPFPAYNSADPHALDRNLDESITRCSSMDTAFSSFVDETGIRFNKTYYFRQEDFDTYSWKGVKNIVNSNLPSSVGMAVVMTATVIVHPLLFLAGAIWAVGLFHAVEQGYKFYSDGTFGELFWADSDPNSKVSKERRLANEPEREVPSSGLPLESTSDENSSVLMKIGPVDAMPAKVVMLPPAEGEMTLIVPDMKDSTRSKPFEPMNSADDAGNTERIHSHFPPLKKCIVKDIPFPNLHAAEFFRVFFSDTAPYSMKDFQAERGDIDMTFGQWQKITLAEDDADFPPRFTDNATVKKRELAFKTLTKSYFGPTYASAEKVQRVTRIKDSWMVLECQTKLTDIPLGDRFQILETWIVRTERKGEKLKSNDANNVDSTERRRRKRAQGYDLISFLTVYMEVKMLRSCSLEAQIRKHTESTMKELVTSWCSKATKALELAEQHKADRIRKNQVTDDSVDITELHEDESKTQQEESPETQNEESVTKEKERLMAIHKSKLQEIERRIAVGDLKDLASDTIEVKHALVDGRRSVTIMGSSARTGQERRHQTIIAESPEKKNPMTKGVIRATRRKEK